MQRAVLKASVLAVALALTAESLEAIAASGQTACNGDVALVFDASGSMAGPGFGEDDVTRIEKARQALARVLPAVAPVRNIGLVVYGPGSAGPCGGIDLKAAPGPNSAEHLLELLKPVQPYGQTPLTNAVEEAAEVLDFRSRPATIVLVTDGEETCGGNPCPAGLALEKAGADITVHVIGYMTRFANQVGGQQPARCLAEQTGGFYLTAETADELTAALQRTLGCDSLSKTRGKVRVAGVSQCAPGPQC